MKVDMKFIMIIAMIVIVMIIVNSHDDGLFAQFYQLFFRL